MAKRKRIVGSVGGKDFAFDVAGNRMRVEERSIPLEPLETHVLRILLSNRGQLTPASALVHARGEAPPATAVERAIASLKKKLAGTGLEIKAKQRVGYEIHAFRLPELNRRLSDKILLAMSQAVAAGNKDVARQLHLAWELAKERERQWLKSRKARDQRAAPAKK